MRLKTYRKLIGSYHTKAYASTLLYYFYPELPIDRAQCTRGEFRFVEDLTDSPKGIGKGYLRYTPRVYSLDCMHEVVDVPPIEIRMDSLLEKVYNSDLYSDWKNQFIRAFYRNEQRNRWSTRTEFFYKCYRTSYLDVIDYKAKVIYEMKWEYIEACLIQWHREPYKDYYKPIPPHHRQHQRHQARVK